MRFILTLPTLTCVTFTTSAVLLASVASADTFMAATQVKEVTLSPSLAIVNRTASVDVPAGQHRLLLSGLPSTVSMESLQLSHPGLQRVGLYVRESFLVPEDVDTPERLAAKAALEAIKAEIAQVKQEAAEARLSADGAEATLAFLAQIGKAKGLSLTDASALQALLSTIASETTSARQIILTAEAQSRGFETKLEELEDDRRAAARALKALSQQDEDRLYLALDVIAPEAVSATIDVTYVTEDAAGWAPSYTFDLSSGADASLTLSRDVKLWQNTGEDWTDVALRVTTSTPSEWPSPAELYPQKYRIADPRPEPKAEFRDAPMMSMSAEPIIIEEAGAGAELGAAGVTYSFAEPVTLRSGTEAALLSLQELDLNPEVMAKAVPSRDETAFRVARFTNTSGEELLPADDVWLLLDGDLVGVTQFPGLTAGEEIELGYGRIDGLKISRAVLDQSEGERGVISRSNERNTRAEIEVENLTQVSWPIRILDQVPYSEQEDLEISWSASPAVSLENVDKQRGILAWDLTLDPGATRSLTLDTKVKWPDGKELR